MQAMTMDMICGKESRIVTMLALTIAFCVMSGVFGYLNDTMSLFSEAAHKLSDVIALIVALFAIVMSNKTQSSQNTYGWIRCEVLGALVNAVFLLALCFAQLVHSVQELTTEHEDTSCMLIAIVAAAGLGISLLGVFLFIGYTPGFRHGNLLCECARDENELIHQTNCDSNENLDTGEECDDNCGEELNTALIKQPRPATGSQLNMRGLLLHILMDLLTSIVIISSVLTIEYTTSDWKYYVYPVGCIIIVVIVAALAIPLMKESAYILLQMVPKHISVGFLKKKLTNVICEVGNVHEIHIWRLEGDIIIATAHITIKDRKEYVRISRKVKDFFHDHGIHSTTVQPEFVLDGEFSESQECVLECHEDSCKTAQCCIGEKGKTKELLDNLEQEPLIERLLSVEKSQVTDVFYIEENGNEVSTCNSTNSQI